MKKAFISIFAIMLTVALMVSAVLPASAEALPDPYSKFIFNLWSEYVKDCKELTGSEPTIEGDISYREINGYSSDDESKNFHLVLATYGSTKETFSYRTDIGEYTYYNPLRNTGREYLVHLYNQDLVYTVPEAYKNNIEGINSALAPLYGEAVLKNGDANGDKEVNIKDATYLQKYTAKLESVNKIYSIELFERGADVNRDHKINVKDATLLQKQIAKVVVPTVYESLPASADSIKYEEVNLGYCASFGNSDRLITNIEQYKSYPINSGKEYTEEFFEENALVHIYRNYHTGMVKGFVWGVYREGNTLYVKYGETHPYFGSGVTDDVGSFNTSLEIDKDLIQGVEKLAVEVTTYRNSPNDY